jgi:hypothetical protein
LSDRRINLTEDDFGGPQAPVPGPGPGTVETAVAAASAGRRIAGLPLVPAALTALAVTVAVSVGVVVVVKDDEATKQDFCQALADGQEDIRTNIPETPTGELEGEEALGLIVQAFGGIGRYETMLDNLVEESPPEIKTEMTTARDTFTESMDAVPDAVSDPLGAIVGTVFNNLLHQSSFQKVDAYAEENCGSTVFGTGQPLR